MTNTITLIPEQQPLPAFGIMTDYNYPGKRTRVTIWSGSFYSQYDGEAYSRPNGWTIKLDYVEETIKVDGPNTRTDANYQEVDKLISDAVNDYLISHGWTYATPSAVTA